MKIILCLLLGSTHSPPLRVEVYLDQQPVTMQVDTGAAVSVISHNVFQNLWDSSPSLMKSDVKLQSYTGEQIGVIGCFTTSVSYQGQKKNLPLLVVEGSGPSLLGRNWLYSLCLNWRELNILWSGSLIRSGITPCQLCGSIPTRTGYISGNNCGFVCSSRCSTKIL